MIAATVLEERLVPIYALGLGILLVLLSVVTPHERSVTAWIPAAFGGVFIILGLLGFRPALRKHAMHAAAGLALLGAVGAGIRAASAGMRFAQGKDVNSNALASQCVMTVLCLAFLAMCIRTFVMARRARMRSPTEKAAV